MSSHGVRKVDEEALAENLKASLVGQMTAALETLSQCIEHCPDSEWHESHGDYPFSQVVFHTLYYADFYLERNEREFRNQQFHLNHGDEFGDYEESADRAATNLYDRAFCRNYLRYCLEKCRSVIAEDNAASLAGPSGISFRPGSRAALYVYGIRHIQHHAAQLGLRIQQISGRELSWVSGGA